MAKVADLCHVEVLNCLGQSWKSHALRYGIAEIQSGHHTELETADLGQECAKNNRETFIRSTSHGIIKITSTSLM